MKSNQDASNSTHKGPPIPVRFQPGEDEFLHEAADATGLNISELIRRGVRLLQRQRESLQSYGFLLDLGK